MFSRRAVASCHVRRNAQRTRFPCRSLATVTDSSSASTSSAVPPLAPSKPKKESPKYTLNAAVILNRSPIITRTPTAFEKSYHAYQSRIQRALFNPFPNEFYFKPGSLLEGKFAAEEREREKEAFGGPGRSDSSDSDDAAIAASKQVMEVLGEEEAVKPMPRVHESDLKGDVKSLDRKGERNLYLLVRGKNAAGKEIWRFPQGDVQAGELLHDAARRDLHAECGSFMDTWVVSRNPIGVHQPSLSDENYIFFYKAHILAGQARPDGKNVHDFAWLTKEEIRTRVDQSYWVSVEDMLSDF
ncbi:54S ribosomal protein L17 mitochondrial [Steccherinum ochraceum]|uniref:Large ribosomal subunit protein mL46 n=1 Tax=Steccherinum ochraceum TaxID=92696 RepID=A0A4R0RI49_9APHY|nr:54S ribosomal protein L17 mitochondrial [Steccherinum ochraceum]